MWRSKGWEVGHVKYLCPFRGCHSCREQNPLGVNIWFLSGHSAEGSSEKALQHTTERDIVSIKFLVALKRKTYAFMMDCAWNVCVFGVMLYSSLTQCLKKGNFDSSYTWYVIAPYWEEIPYCFWWRSTVSWGHVRWKPENLVISITHGRKHNFHTYHGYSLYEEKGP